MPERLSDGERAGGAVTNPRGTERLHEYWVHGEGAAKIRWGEPGDFDRCVLHLGKYIADPKGYCDLAHHAALGMWPAQHAEMVKAGRNAPMGYTEARAPMDTADINDLPDSAFAHIEPGGSKDSSGKTVPRSLRHFPIHDAAHVRNALARASQSPFGEKAMPKIKAAAAKFGIKVGDDDSASRVSGRPLERRFTQAVVGIVLLGGEETRKDPDAPRRIGGYAAKWNTYSRDLGHFVEQLLPATYNKSRGDGWPDVICRFNHDDAQLLGTIAGRTLDLGMDRDGLLYDVDPPPSMRHVIEWVERGDVRKSSHAFRCVEDEWSMTSEGATLRTIHEASLVDVAPVVTPAYADTTAGLRSLAVRFDADFEEVRSLAEAHDLRRFFVRTDTDGGARPRKTMYPAAAMAMLQARRADPFEE